MQLERGLGASTGDRPINMVIIDQYDLLDTKNLVDIVDFVAVG